MMLELLFAEFLTNIYIFGYESIFVRNSFHPLHKKMKFFIFQMKFPADMVTFTEEIINGKFFVQRSYSPRAFFEGISGIISAFVDTFLNLIVSFNFLHSNY